MPPPPAVQPPFPAERPLVSVIVPVYKVEKYLPRCLESIAAQTYPNLDVILVDDGSPDACGEMCEAYAREHPGTRVLHQPNQGLSAARNNAVPLAKGDWITFIDSDDMVTPDYVEYLVGLAMRHEADIAVGGFVYDYGRPMPEESPRDAGTMVLTPVETLRLMNYGLGFGSFAWGKLYRKGLVVSHPYPVGKLYEDLATTFKIVGDSKRIVFGKKRIYCWLQRSGSIMASQFNERQLDGLEAAQAQLDYVSAHFPEALPAARYRHAAKGVELAKVLFETGGDPAVWKRLRSHILVCARDVLRDPFAKKSMKMRILAAMAGYHPAKWTLSFHDWLKRRVL